MPSFTRNAEHLAEDCEDFDCPRFPCRMYHAGYLAAQNREYARGFADGEATGFASGFAAGAASAAGSG
jgi:hypothetical protein